MWNFINNLVCSLISLFVSIFFMRCVLKRRNNKILIRDLLILFCFAILTALLYELDYSMIKTFVFCLAYVVLFNRLFNLKIYQSLMYAVIFIICLAISEIIVFLFLTNILNVNSDYLYGTFAVSILSNIVIGLGAVVVGYALRSLLIKVVNLKIKNYTIIYIVLLFGCTIYFFYATFKNIYTGIGMVSGITVICILLCVLLNLLIQMYRNNELTIKYDKLLEFIKKYEIEIDNQRMMRHEIKNQLLTIKSKIIDKDKNKNIVSYIDEILEDNRKEIKHSEYAKLNPLPPNGIKGLFYFKVSEANDKDIDVSINISKQVENSTLAHLDSLTFNQVGKLFGIILDNAIEAAEIADEKKIGIEVYVASENVVCIISNTFKDSVVGTRLLLPKTSKGYGRGHGLLLAKTIINSNNRFDLETSVVDDLYIQKLTIK